jgi:mannosyltransferase OCH1-like enzyme
MAIKKIIPSILEGVVKKKEYSYVFIAILLLIFFLGFKYIMVDGTVKKESMEQKNTNGNGNDNDNDKKEEKTIPKIIIQTWKNREIPLKYQLLQKELIKKNPDYEYLFFTDEDIDLFLKLEYPDYYVSFQKLPILIQKIDFFRYIAIYHYGGFYFDLDMECMESLDNKILKHDNVIPVDDKFSQSKKDLNRQWMEYQGENTIQGENIILGQYAFGAARHSAFMKFLADNIHFNIDTIVKDYDTKIKNNISNFEYFVYSTTGPDYVTYMYKNYYQKWEIFILDYSKRQHFGKYARHRYFGTWKNNTNN